MQVGAAVSVKRIVGRDAIDTVYELAFQFVNLAKEKGAAVNVDASLGYAMQMLCADPEAHLLSRHPEIWASDDLGQFDEALPNGEDWMWGHSLGDRTAMVSPALVHLPRRKANPFDRGCDKRRD